MKREHWPEVAGDGDGRGLGRRGLQGGGAAVMARLEDWLDGKMGLWRQGRGWAGSGEAERWEWRATPGAGAGASDGDAGGWDWRRRRQGLGLATALALALVLSGDESLMINEGWWGRSESLMSLRDERAWWKKRNGFRGFERSTAGWE